MRALNLGLALVALTTTSVAAPVSATDGAREWDFAVTLDDKPIGRHHFRLEPGAGQGALLLTSAADYRVKILGLTVFRYHHEAREQWQGDCLTALSARTDDDGRQSAVQAVADASGVRIAITSPGADQPAQPQWVAGCLMSFAYWNPAMRRQTRLLNPQTGVVEAVQITRTSAGSINVAGQPVAAEAWRINGAAEPIEVWYSAAGDWVGLDARVAGKRKLSYRLQ